MIKINSHQKNDYKPEENHNTALQTELKFFKQLWFINAKIKNWYVWKISQKKKRIDWTQEREKGQITSEMKIKLQGVQRKILIPLGALKKGKNNQRNENVMKK